MTFFTLSPAAGGSPVIFFSALRFSSDIDRGTYIAVLINQNRKLVQKKYYRHPLSTCIMVSICNTIKPKLTWVPIIREPVEIIPENRNQCLWSQTFWHRTTPCRHSNVLGWFFTSSEKGKLTQRQWSYKTLPWLCFTLVFIQSCRWRHFNMKYANFLKQKGRSKYHNYIVKQHWIFMK